MLGPEEVRILLALAMLSLASAWDLRSRSVSDWLWIVFGAAAAILFALDIPAAEELPMMILGLGMVAGVSFAAYRTGLFGGADAIGVVVLALLVPEYTGRYMQAGEPGILFPLTVFTNALLISAFQVAANVARNLVSLRRGLFVGFEQESASKKAVAFLIGYRATNPRFAFPIEGGGSQRKFDFGFRNAETANYESRKDVWVTPGIPFLVFLLAGFVVSILFGDLVSLLF
ncbi:A24 family peptidase C-terminal domain-containing protein [Nitrososphaera sp.]|uniref:A24 family peptidase C-terminal domain-containing protein n=1 Tax=Nitrososphaera sp. TaxID=1971748 RepID=UPI003177B668